MDAALILAVLLALLVGFLIIQGLTRNAVFEIVFYSVWIYVLLFFGGLELVHWLAPKQIDTIVPYLVPLPVMLMVIALIAKRMKAIAKPGGSGS